MSEVLKCLIIGSGPAGYSAAIYAARAGLKPVLITGMEMGGQLMQTTDVENYPGYKNGILGPEMMEDFRAQAERMGTDIRFGLVKKVDFTGVNHKVWLDDDSEIQAQTVIICTGAAAKWLGIPSEERLNGRGVSACAVCDGFFHKGNEVVIVGAGDTACEEALYLSNLCPTVHMIVRKGEMRASKIMQERVLKTKNIKVYFNSETDEILGEEKVNGVRIKNNITGEKLEIHNISGFFTAIGHKPNVFAAGDVQDKVYRQAVTSAGTGCIAALDAERYLGELGH